jgi:hypothetical protein
LGQQNLLVAFVVLLAIGAATRWAWLGLLLLLLAITIKPSVGLMLLPFCYWQRKSRICWLLLGLGLLAMVGAGWGHWGQYLFQSNTGSSAAWLAVMQSSAYNQALGGVVYQILPGLPYYTVAVLGIGLLYTFLTWRASKQVALSAETVAIPGELALFMLPALLLCFLLGPVSWLEHAVVALPVLALAFPSFIVQIVTREVAPRFTWLALFLVVYWAFAYSGIELDAPFGTLVVLQAQPYHFLFLGLITLLGSTKRAQA